MATDLEAHERECAVRHEAFQETLKQYDARMTRVEAALIGLYPFLILTVAFAKIFS